MRKGLMVISFLMVSISSFSQDTTTKELYVIGNIGVTNNGISIIPTFSLKQPAFNLSYSLSRGGRFSIDPDLRLAFDGKKGGGIVWFRYKLKTEGKFKVNIGILNQSRIRSESSTLFERQRCQSFCIALF